MKYRLSNVKELIKLIYETSPGYFIVLLFNTIVGSVGTYINLWVSKIVIDQLVNTHNISMCFKLIILMVVSGAMIVSRFFRKNSFDRLVAASQPAM